MIMLAGAKLLFWCAVINVAILTLWFMAFMFARGFIYRLHSRWFKLSDSQFDAVHYGGMALYKVLILVFNIVPLVALVFFA